MVLEAGFITQLPEEIILEVCPFRVSISNPIKEIQGKQIIKLNTTANFQIPAMG
jgi:hypothetical protein